jgi:hypothetical protein
MTISKAWLGPAMTEKKSRANPSEKPPVPKSLALISNPPPANSLFLLKEENTK